MGLRAWTGGLVLLVLACGGSTFEAAGSGGSAGASGGSGGSSGGSGGSSGGSGGSSGGSGGSAGVGGSGGSASCPPTAPAPGAPCVESDQTCSYENGCCFDSFTCRADGWQYDGCGAPPIAAVCPGVPPVSGMGCDSCVTPLECIYEACETQGQYVASCRDNLWSVQIEPCDGVTCQVGIGFAQQFDKSCSSDADCTMEATGADCCGTPLVVGVNINAAARLRAAWGACVPTLLICDCVSRLPQTEDGNSAPDFASISVFCSDGQCSTVVPF
jgi:hypothetical protein